VHVSTDYVFDGERGDYTEEDRPNPRGVYAVTKWLGEEAVRVLAPSRSIARTAVVYDWPPAARPNFGAWLVGALGRGEEVRLFADQFVSPTLASHLAEMLAELGERRLPGIWHTAGAQVINRVAFAEALCARFGFDPGLIVRSRLSEAGLASPRPAKSGLSVEKAQAQLSAAPLGLEASLSRFHAAWLEANAQPHLLQTEGRT
jgi:dTDP-4-dehydrorhamnose reductase